MLMRLPVSASRQAAFADVGSADNRDDGHGWHLIPSLEGYSMPLAVVRRIS